MTDLLAPTTAMGAVTLNVADLDAMTAYYSDAVGLDVLGAAGGRVTLGHGSRPVVVLEHAPALRHAGPREAGLYHTAVVFDSRPALASAVLSVARALPGTFVGSSDHLVSQAFYFDDPEGNGVELYWDRDRSEWPRDEGSIVMGTVRLDPDAFLGEHLTDAGRSGPLREDAAVGHVHLSVGDVDTAHAFYVDTLGFEQTALLPGQALFVSAGGYHHHMAMNVWNSRGAGRRARTLGLGRVDIVVPTADDVGAASDRLRAAGFAPRDDGRTVEVDDPWGNLLRLITPHPG